MKSILKAPQVITTLPRSRCHTLTSWLMSPGGSGSFPPSLPSPCSYCPVICGSCCVLRFLWMLSSILFYRSIGLIMLCQAILPDLATPEGLGSTLTAVSWPPECPSLGPATLTGIDENQGCVEGDLILREMQGTKEVGKVEYGTDELAAACRGGDGESKRGSWFSRAPPFGHLEQGEPQPWTGALKRTGVRNFSFPPAPHPRLGTAPGHHICLQRRLYGCQHCRPGTSSQARLPLLLEKGEEVRRAVSSKARKARN